MINEKLKDYISRHIFPLYQENDLGHDINHILYVWNRSLNFSKSLHDINYDILYTIVAYHDIGHHIDAKRHEIISSEFFSKDIGIKEFFNETEQRIIMEAIEDHRASISYTPRSIYGKIISSADRNVSIDDILRRTYNYRIAHSPSVTFEELINESYNHLLDKFGSNGYATEKMYFEDPDFEIFLENLSTLLQDKNVFINEFVRVNKLAFELLKYRIQEYTPFDEQELRDKESICLFMKEHDNVLTRANTLGHLTASAFVVDSSEQKMLMVNHNIFNGLIYPGGHADGESDLLNVAIREVYEETGVHTLPLFDGSIFSIQALPIKGHIKHGKYVSAHIHYDILYALQVADDEENKIRVLESENNDVKWIDFKTLENIEQVEWIKPINRKLIKKFRMRGNK